MRVSIKASCDRVIIFRDVHFWFHTVNKTLFSPESRFSVDSLNFFTPALS
jgi:hypothetical protein